MQFSYSFQIEKRDVSPILAATLALAPVFLSLVRVGEAARATKHEWTEDKLTATQSKVSTGITNVATSLDVPDGAVFKANDVWVNYETDERFKVTAIATNTLTITRAAGGTAAAMTANDVLKLVSRPKLQGTTPGDDAGQAPTFGHNFTQIFDRTASVSKTAQAVEKYGMDDALDYQVKVQMDQLAREMNMTAIYGVKQQPAANTPGMLGGLLSFLDQAGAATIDAAGAAVSRTLVNDGFEKAFNNGAGELVMLCAPNQARKITALDANYQIVRENTTTGNTILEFKGDIAGANRAAKIVVDPNYPKRRVDLVDISRVELNPLTGRQMSDEDATPNGADYVARRILGEYTLTVKNALDAHVSIKGLSA